MKPARLDRAWIALAAGGIAAWLASGTRAPEPPKPAPAPPPLATVEVLVAKSDHRRRPGGRRPRCRLADLAGGTPRSRASSKSPTGRTPSKDFVGAIARSPVRPASRSAKPRSSSPRARGYMAAILPRGMRAISTEISPETGAGGFILPNDHVDVMLSRRDKARGKATGVEKHISETILTNVRVLAIDQTVEEKNGQHVVVGKTATLELDSAPGRDAGAVASARHAVARVAQPRSIRKRQSRRRRRRTSADRINTVRYGVSTQTTPHDRHGGTSMATSDADSHRSVGGADRDGAARAAAHRAARRPTRRSPTRRSPDPRSPQATSVAVRSARRRQIGRHRPAARHQGCAGRPIPRSPTRWSAPSRRAYIIGVKVGQTNIYFFDAEGRQMAGFDIAVTRDLNGIRAALRQVAAGRRYPRRGHRRGRRADRHGVEPGRSAAGLRHLAAARSPATAARSSTASSCAAATRSCSR